MEILEMSLEELNQEIKRLAPIVNKRIVRLQNKEGKIFEQSLDYIQKLAFASGYGKGINKTTQTGLNFATATPQTVQEGRARLTALNKAYKMKTSTLSGIKESEKARKKTFEEMLSDEKKQIKLTWEEYHELIEMLENTEDKYASSDQIIALFEKYVTNRKKFNSFNDFKMFVYNTRNDVLPEPQLEQLFEKRPSSDSVLKFNKKLGALEWT